ncbi:hypothetical protein KAU18_02735 [Candidatus Bathyarchaeota archaeon]|nr:hypothetical protein [Candidatus Bathyarchaeota archaeon]
MGQPVNLEDETNLKDELNESLPRFGLEGWKVVLIPDEKQTIGGQVLAEEKTILVFEKDHVKARDALIHEVVEIKLQPLIAEYQEAVNSLIKLVERLTYREKERAINDLVPYLRYVFDDKK